MTDLRTQLQELFPTTPIVRLKDICLKIAGISKVRVGERRTFNEYDEISLNNIDEMGVIYVPQERREYELASASVIMKQALNEGDVIVLQRGMISKIGIVGAKENYKRIIVGNNSMIRIQFAASFRNELARFVQTYLQHPMVKAYLDSAITCGSEKRKILSSAFLANMPIPHFKKVNNGLNFSDLIHMRLAMSVEANRVLALAQELVKQCKELEDESIVIGVGEYKELVQACGRDRGMKGTIKSIHLDIQRLLDKTTISIKGKK